MIEWMNGWVNEWVSEWINDWVSELMIDWVNEWVSEWINDWVSGWVNEWVSEWITDWVSGWVNDWVSEWAGAPQVTFVEEPSQPQVSLWARGGWVGRNLSSQHEQSNCPSSGNRSSVALLPWGLAGGKWVECVNLVLQPPGPTELWATVRVVAKAMALKIHRKNLVMVKGHCEQPEW